MSLASNKGHFQKTLLRIFMVEMAESNYKLKICHRERTTPTRITNSARESAYKQEWDCQRAWWPATHRSCTGQPIYQRIPFLEEIEFQRLFPSPLPKKKKFSPLSTNLSDISSLIPLSLKTLFELFTMIRIVQTLASPKSVTKCPSVLSLANQWLRASPPIMRAKRLSINYR